MNEKEKILCTVAEDVEWRRFTPVTQDQEQQIKAFQVIQEKGLSPEDVVLILSTYKLNEQADANELKSFQFHYSRKSKYEPTDLREMREHSMVHDICMMLEELNFSVYDADRLLERIRESIFRTSKVNRSAYLSKLYQRD